MQRNFWHALDKLYLTCNHYTHPDSSQYAEVRIEVDERGCTDVHDVSTSFLGSCFQVIIAVESWEESTRHAAASSDFIQTANK